ncbi:MAG: ATP-binding protein [Herminiimonas sp.]|nr:ATP-binding protein [Herminiimonas sp.]
MPSNQGPRQQSANPEPAFRIRDLHSSNGGPYTLDASKGECIAIRGASGSGKSVFLRMVADLDPNTGEVSLDGMPRARTPAPAWRRKVIYQAAEAAWWEPTAALHFSPAEKDFALPLLARLGLGTNLMDSPIARLSTGERQRLALIRSLSRQPVVLLLDEPTSSLDQESTAAVEGLLRELMGKGLCLLMVTHSPEQAQRLGTRIMEIEQGRMRHQHHNSQPY